MPLQICPKCKRFHYVPGECPGTAAGSPSGKAPGFGPGTAGSSPAPAAKQQVVSRLKGEKKSTAAPTEAAKVATPARTLADRRGGSERPPAAVPPASRKAVAKKVRQADQEAAVEPAADTLKQAEAAAAHLAPKKRGRPKGKTDRKAYQRELMRDRRAKLKNQPKG